MLRFFRRKSRSRSGAAGRSATSPRPELSSGNRDPRSEDLRPHEVRDRNSALPHYKRGGFRARQIGEIGYRAYRPGDERSILDGFNETFKLDRGLDYWHWKFADVPFGRFMSVAVDTDGMVLAFYGAVPLVWQYDGKRKLAGLGADVYCRRHPDLIRRNVFIETLNHFLEANMAHSTAAGAAGSDSAEGERLSIVFGFAGRTASRLYQHKTPYIGPEPIALFERPIAGGANAAGANAGGNSPYSVVAGEAAIGLLDRLWPRIAARHPRIAVRDAAWARRRFPDRPDVAYGYVALVDGTGQPAAWGVHTVTGEAFHVCDIMWDGRPDALEQLDAIFRRDAAAAGCATSLMVLQNGGELADRMAAAGWVEGVFPHGGSWIMQTADPDIGPDILTTFYLTYADTDLV